jgi:hypothetical protein
MSNLGCNEHCCKYIMHHLTAAAKWYYKSLCNSCEILYIKRVNIHAIKSTQHRKGKNALVQQKVAKSSERSEDSGRFAFRVFS